MANSVIAADGIFTELQREIEEFMATNAVAIAAFMSESPAQDLKRLRPVIDDSLGRIRWISTTIAKSRMTESIQFLLGWLATVEGQRLHGGAGKPASWLVATLVYEILSQRLTSPPSPNAFTTTTTKDSAEKTVELILDRCIVVFQEAFQSDAARAVESSSGFFAFKPAVLSHFRTPTPESTLLDNVVVAWRLVLSVAALYSLNPVRLRVQRQLLQDLLQSKNAMTAAKDYLMLKNLASIRLGLNVTDFLWPNTFTHKVKDAALLLKILQPLTLKPYKPSTRLATISTIASMLNRELESYSLAQLQQIHGAVHAVSEWNSAISDLHAVSLKLCGKREFAVAAWELRVALLSLSPNEIFGRYWKEDAHALLRVQYQQNKDGGGAGPHAGTILECVERCFTHILKRHFLTERRVPTELDCMEIINTTQAWSFFAYPKQRSLQKLRDQVIPLLVRISIGIAAYNMAYAVQSHLRRLLLEADHIFDEKKLVGLEALLAVIETTRENHESRLMHGDADTLPLDHRILSANRATLGELVGQTLIEANTHFGADLLIENSVVHAASSSGGGLSPPVLSGSSAAANSKYLRDEYRRSLAIQSYACALTTFKYVYSALELSDDQKMLILARSCIHNEPLVRESAAATLRHIITHERHQAGVVFRCLTDYLFRLSNHLTKPRDFDAFLVLIDMITSLLRIVTVDDSSSDEFPPWDTKKARQESLLQIESIAVYLLVFEDTRLLEAAVHAFELVAQAKSIPFGGQEMMAATVERPRVIDVLREAEWEIQELLFSFESATLIESLTTKDLGFFRQLMSDLGVGQRASFRWSTCLTIVFARLSMWNPEVAAFMWTDVNDKVTKLEPAMTSSGIFDGDHASSNSFELARWRNLAILATSTACPNLLFQASYDDGDEGDNCSVDNDETQSKGGSVQSVISSSSVEALFKRLCRYLKSPSIEQKKAVIVALGSTHISSIPILIEVLQKYEAEAFLSSPDDSQPSSRHASLGEIPQQISPPLQSPPTALYTGVNGHEQVVGRKLTKEQKIKNQKAIAQLHLQWAIGRCFRLLLQATQQRPLVADDTTREALRRLQVVSMGVLGKMAMSFAAIQQQRRGPQTSGLTARDVPHHILFMMQQDFCSSVRCVAILLRENRSQYGSVRRRHNMTKDASISSKRSAHRWSISSSAQPYNSYRDSSADESTSVFDLQHREAWYQLLLSWCHSFRSLANSRLSANLSGEFFSLQSPARDHWLQRCDVFGERVDDSIIPWQWMDESDATRALAIEEAAMASFQRFFLCQTAFATLPVVVQGPLFLPTPITQDSTVFRWLDECFAVDTTGSGDNPAVPHFGSLQRYCHCILRAFLHSEFRVFAEVCVDKSFFSVASGDKHNVAKHYFEAICDVADNLKREIQNGPASTVSKSATTTTAKTMKTSFITGTNLQIRVCHVIMMHLGIEADARQRERAVGLVNDLYDDHALHDPSIDQRPFQLNAMASSSKRSSSAFVAQVTNRMQVAGASYLVSKLASQAYPMSMSILKFLACCESMQQKKMLTVVLPWLAEVNLIESSPTFDSEQLLSLLFRITTNLITTCNDQLEQAWLTLAFVSPPATVEAEASHVQASSNLAKVLQFLFLQRATPVRLSTAKMVVWWLCRWQSAAHEVLRELLLLVESRRLLSAESSSVPGGGGQPVASPTIQPVDDVFVLVILLSDSCCHLSSIPSYMYQHPGMRDAMVVQAVHYAFLTLFALALDPKAFAVHRSIASPSGGGADELQQQSLYVDANNDCIVLLRNMVSQLSAPTELLEPIIDELARWSQSWTHQLGEDEIPHQRNRRDSTSSLPLRDQKSSRQFEQAMSSFASCLPLAIRSAWALECMKEITLALIPGSTLLSPTTSRCNNVQVLYCVRFGLLGYRVLTPEFHGDVFLSLLDLLHHALEEHPRDPPNATAVIRDTLDTLRSMVECMPPRRLALYPQILWVCVALLNQYKNEYLQFHTEVMLLLVEVLRVPHFATNSLLQDVLLSKKPARWRNDQASVLRTMVWSLDRGSSMTHQLTLHVVTRLLLLQCPVFHEDTTEHLVISTMTLVPFLLATMVGSGETMPVAETQGNNNADEDESADVGIESISWEADSINISTDLHFAWVAAGSSSLADVFAAFLHAKDEDEEVPNDDTSNAELGRSFAHSFVTAFIEQLTGNDTPTLITMCFEILVKILAAEDIRKREQRHHAGVSIAAQQGDAIVTATLWLVEAFMAELEERKLSWRPTSALLGSLARLVREQEQTETWQAAVRIMACLGSSNRTASGSSVLTPVVKSKPQLTVTTTGAKEPNPAIDPGRSSSGAGTPSKKERTTSGARMFMGLLGHKSSPTGSNQNSDQQDHPRHSPPANNQDVGRKKTSNSIDPSEDRSASPLPSRREL